MDEAVKNATNYEKNTDEMPWLQEYPQLLRTRSNAFRYYKAQGLLAVSKADFIDSKNGNIRMGKTVLVQLADLIAAPDALDSLLEILQEARGKVGK